MFFNSRRSTVHATHGIVATSQPLAAMAGLRILMDGGNAVDARRGYRRHAQCSGTDVHGRRRRPVRPHLESRPAAGRSPQRQRTRARRRQHR